MAEAGAVWILAILLACLTKRCLLCLAGLVKKAVIGGICGIFGVVKRAIFWLAGLALKAVVEGIFGTIKRAVSGLVLRTCKLFVQADSTVEMAKVGVTEDEVDGCSSYEGTVETVVVIAPPPRRRSPRNLQHINYKV